MLICHTAAITVIHGTVDHTTAPHGQLVMCAHEFLWAEVNIGAFQIEDFLAVFELDVVEVGLWVTASILDAKGGVMLGQSRS